MIKEISIDVWQNFVKNNPQSTVFHHRNWIELLAHQYDFKIKIIGLYEEYQLVAGIPFLETRSFAGKKKLISLPFTDEIKPLYSNNDEFIKLLAYIFQKYKHQFYRIEIRSCVPKNIVIFSDDNYVKHILDLSSDIDLLFNNFKKTQVQQCVLKAQKMGVRVENRTDENAIKAFFKLNLQVRKSHGLPSQPYSFFKNLKQKIFDKDMGFVIVASLKDEVIAASIFLHFNNTVIYKYSVSDYNFLKYCPNNLVLWEAIRWAHEKRYKLFDFGISPKENLGLRRFKSGWGTKEIDISYNFLQVKGQPNTGKVGRNKYTTWTIRKLPLCGIRLIGELFYRYVG